jgi:pimeloyl-ACP methyl ester carboxylesterase
MKRFTRSIKVSLVILISSFFNTSCFWQDEEVPIEDNKTLISATKIGNLTAFEIRLFLDLSGYDIPSSVIQHDVEVYSITYRTTYKGSDITASGIVSIPDTENPIPMVSFHHGTIVAHDDTPTEQSSTIEGAILFAALAAPGFIAVVPDYLGFGSSTQILHPYYVEEYMASAIVDNLKAVKELTDNIKSSFNGDLYLAGYSEGGYATMATHKKIEESGLNGFNLVASFPAAGGYDIKDMQEYLFSLETYDDPYYLAYVALSYNKTFDWSEPLTDFFNQPYADAIPELFDGSKSGGTINSFLSDTLSVYINTNLIDSIDLKPRFQYIVQALEENSLTDWTPSAKMYMYHGDADTTVPYQNSEVTYQQLLANGTSPGIIEFITLPGATHGSGVQPYIEDMVAKLLELSNLNN